MNNVQNKSTIIVKILTLQTLKDVWLSEPDEKMFEKVFGEQVVVSVEAFKAVAEKFDWECFANGLLTVENELIFKERIKPQQKEFQDFLAPYLNTYYEAIELLKSEFDQTTEAGKEAFSNNEKRLDKTLKDATDTQRKIYEEVRATIFAEIYLSQ